MSDDRALAPLDDLGWIYRQDEGGEQLINPKEIAFIETYSVKDEKGPWLLAFGLKTGEHELSSFETEEERAEFIRHIAKCMQ